MARLRTGRPPGRPPTLLAPLAFYLVRKSGYAPELVARFLGISPGTVRTYVSRVRRHSRKPAPPRRFSPVPSRPVVRPGPPEWVWPPKRPRAEVRA